MTPKNSFSRNSLFKYLKNGLEGAFFFRPFFFSIHRNSRLYVGGCAIRWRSNGTEAILWVSWSHANNSACIHDAKAKNRDACKIKSTFKTHTTHFYLHIPHCDHMYMEGEPCWTIAKGLVGPLLPCIQSVATWQDKVVKIHGGLRHHHHPRSFRRCRSQWTGTKNSY